MICSAWYGFLKLPTFKLLKIAEYDYFRLCAEDIQGYSSLTLQFDLGLVTWIFLITKGYFRPCMFTYTLFGFDDGRKM